MGGKAVSSERGRVLKALISNWKYPLVPSLTPKQEVSSSGSNFYSKATEVGLSESNLMVKVIPSGRDVNGPHLGLQKRALRYQGYTVYWLSWLVLSLSGTGNGIDGVYLELCIPSHFTL